MYSAADLKKGLKIEIEGVPYVITDFEFCKPGKGTALYRCRLKNMVNGSSMDRTFRPVDKVDVPNLEEREVHYSYQDGDNYIFSDSETYEDIQITKDQLGDKTFFLLDDMVCNVLFYNGKPIDITLPTFITRTVVETEPGARGDTASSNVMKPAKLDNGYELMVPLFINQGDTIKVDTRTGGYAERVSKG
ncbi:MAG: elongation factor P [Lentisphaeria bacterium]|nr:elongation factor P [Lentisphaeria bacterium]